MQKQLRNYYMSGLARRLPLMSILEQRNYFQQGFEVEGTESALVIVPLPESVHQKPRLSMGGRGRTAKLARMAAAEEDFLLMGVTAEERYSQQRAL